MADTFIPQQLAERWHMKVEGVYSLIKGGRLSAINVAVKANARKPRWIIPAEAVARFEAARTNVPTEQRKEHRRTAARTWKEFF